MSRLMLSVALVITILGVGCTADHMHTDRVPKEEAKLWSSSGTY